MPDTIKLTPKQKEIVRYMRDGYPLMTGLSETNGKQYFMIASTHNKGYGNTYFNATVFSNLIHKELIYQTNSYPFKYTLTRLGETIKL